MSASQDSYAPGWGADAVAMMASRSVSDRASFAVTLLAAGDVVVDVGCGPGSITEGLARAVGPAGRVLGMDAQRSQVEAATGRARRMEVPNVDFAVADVYSLPVADRTVDVYFSHALYEHLGEPERALREARRVLVPGGTVALAASDWSRARFEPWTPEVARAMSAHYRLRELAGGNPHAGGDLAAAMARVGFTGVTESSHYRVDLTYRELARYVGSRIEAALRADPGDDELRHAAEAARSWATTDGSVEQCWTEAVGSAPQGAEGRGE